MEQRFAIAGQRRPTTMPTLSTGALASILPSVDLPHRSAWANSICQRQPTHERKNALSFEIPKRQRFERLALEFRGRAEAFCTIRWGAVCRSIGPKSTAREMHLL